MGRIFSVCLVLSASGWAGDLTRSSLANGEIAFLWLGSALSPQILNDLYGVENLNEIDTRIVSMLVRALSHDSSGLTGMYVADVAAENS